MDTNPTSARRPLIVAAVVLGVLVLVAVLVVLQGTRTVELEPGTPEAVVQAYVAAITDDDRERAAGYLKEVEEYCYDSDPREFRMVLNDVRVTGERAVVDVSVTSGGGDVFGGGGSMRDQEFVLEMTDGVWLITEVPYRFETC